MQNKKDDMSDDIAEQDVLFRIRRSRFLLARLLTRSLNSSVQVSNFEIQWVDQQLSAIEATTKALGNVQLTSGSVEKRRGRPNRRFAQTILPKISTKIRLDASEPSSLAAKVHNDFGHMNTAAFSADTDKFVFQAG